MKFPIYPVELPENIETEIKKIITYCDRVIAAGKKIQGDSRKTRKPRRKKVD